MARACAAVLDWMGDHDAEINESSACSWPRARRPARRRSGVSGGAYCRLRLLLVGSLAGLVLAVTAGAVAFLQSRSAEEQRQAAVDQKNLGRARELMASAVAAREQDPSLSKLLALEALTFDDQPSYQSTSVLHQVLAADPIIARYHWPAGQDGAPRWTQISPSGELMVAGNQNDYFEVADPRTGSVLWSYPDQPVAGGVGTPYFSADGSQVMVGRTWDDDKLKPPAGALGIILLDARTGQLVRRIDVGPCGGTITAAANGRLLVRRPAEGGDGLCSWPDGPQPLVLTDVKSGTSRTLTDQTWNDGTLSGDGRFAAYELPGGSAGKSVVVNVDTGATVFEVDAQRVQATFGTGAFARQLNNDGSLLLYGDRPMLVYSVKDGSSRPIARLSDVAGESGGAVFDPTGQDVLATFRDGSLKRMDAHWGGIISTWPAVGVGQPSVAADGRTILVGDPTAGRPSCSTVESAATCGTSRRATAGCMAGA